MAYLNWVDYTIIGVYLLVLLVMGKALQKMASSSLEDYFLGGRKLPWWALGITGMSSFLDMSGTMVITSFLFMMGPRGFFIEFRGGAVLVLVFILAWTAKWHRRSGCMTGAEWMIYRFGSGPSGQAARVITAVSQIVVLIFMIAYLVKGAGPFLGTFLDIGPFYSSLIMVVVTTLYTITSGFYGVVFTDLLQSGIILMAVLFIAGLALRAIAGHHEDLAVLAEKVTGSTDWTSSVPHWHTPMPDGYEQYSGLLLCTSFFLFKAVLDGLSSGRDPKFFGARNDREAGLLTYLWTWLMMFRWPMMTGFAVLGLFLVQDLFPDQSKLRESAAVIKQYFPDVQEHQWGDRLAAISDQSHPELAARLRGLLGDEWRAKLKLLSFKGTVNPEGILPSVILFKVGYGFRGLLLVALIAAAMSTFDSQLNGATAFFTRDIYQAYLRPHAPNKELIYASWAFGAVFVAVGFAMAYYATNINDLWGWITMGLTGGLVVPGILRLYWWRFNANGVVFGTLFGLLGPVIQRFLWPDLHDWVQFVVLTSIGLVGAVIGTYLAPPTDRQTLEHFYKTTRPFGLWGPLKATLDPAMRRATDREHFFDLVSVPFILGWQITLFLIPMQILIGAWTSVMVTGPIFAVCLAGVHFLWYRQLPPAEASTAPPAAPAAR